MSSFSSSPFIPKEAEKEEEEIKGASEWFQLACAFRVGSSIPQQLSLGCFNTHTHTERTREEKRRDSFFLTYTDRQPFLLLPIRFFCVSSCQKIRRAQLVLSRQPIRLLARLGKKEICCVRLRIFDHLELKTNWSQEG